MNVPGTYELDKTACFYPVAAYTVQEQITVTDLVVEGATLSLTGGQAPKFTGHAPANADYTLLYEGWEDEYGRYLFNDEAYNGTFSDAQRFTLPEAGKTYYYCLTFLLKDGSIMTFSAEDDLTLTVNGKAVALDDAELFYGDSQLNVDEALSVVASAPASDGGNTSYIEPDYYPDYDEKDEPADEAPVIRDDSDTAPKTGDAPALPMIALAALSLCALAYALRRRAEI